MSVGCIDQELSVLMGADQPGVAQTQTQKPEIRNLGPIGA